MHLKISPEIFEKYPGLHIGVVIASGIDNNSVSDEVISLLRSEEKRIKSEYDTSTLSENPKIAAWRAAYSAFGAKPKKYKCSVESLYRTILQGNSLKPINKVVDLYNLVSIKHIIPAGGDDLDKVEGNIELKLAIGTEPFTELNSQETNNPKQGEVIYSDEKEVLCRRWNWRECNKTKMTKETKNVALVLEALPPFTAEETKSIAEELASLITKFCGGTTKITLLNKENPEVEI